MSSAANASVQDSVQAPSSVDRKGCLWWCLQRESFDVIGNVGFGKDFRASRDIDDTSSNTFALLTNFLQEATLRSNNPMRKYWRSKVIR